MEDEIIIFNGSDLISDKLILDRVREMAEYRDIAALAIECKDELEKISGDSYNASRKQVDENEFLEEDFENKEPWHIKAKPDYSKG